MSTNTQGLSSINRLIWINEAGFWLHVFVIVSGLFMGLVLPFWLVVFLVLLHRIHLHIFDGCVISKAQQKSHGLGENENFLQNMTYRLWGMILTKTHAKRLDYSLTVLTVLFAFISASPLGELLVEGILIGFLIAWGVHACLRIVQSSKQPKLAVCAVGSSCGSVRTSAYAKFLGIPAEIIGLIYFAFIFFGELLLRANILSTSFLVANMMILGGFVSLYFIFMQKSVLNQFCSLCMNVHGASLILAGFGIYRLL